MKKEYDLSKGVRGKFYRPDAQMNLPVYLDPDVETFIHKYAQKKKVDVQTLVNGWLRNNIAVIKSVS